MKYDFEMPKLGHLMEEGTIQRWNKKPGERVVKGELLLTVETDKAALEVESGIEGVVEKILVEEGDTVPVHTLLAVIDVG